MPLPAGTRPTISDGGQDFEPLPEGVYTVTIEDLEQKDQPVFNKPDQQETVWLFKFIVATAPWKDRFLWKRARPIIVAGDKPSTLYQIISRAYKNTGMSEEEAQALDPNELIGRQLQVVVKQKMGKDKKMKNNVTEFLALAGEPVPVDTGTAKDEINIEEIPF